jgi:predicted amidohydrolase
MALVIAAAQSKSVAGKIPENVAEHLRIGALAARHGVQLLVFPELSLTGYELDLARANAIRPDNPVLTPLHDLAEREQMTVVAGAPLLNDKHELHIAALAFQPDRSLSVYTKEYVHESESGVFTSGPGGPTLTVEQATIALSICADASHPKHAARAAECGAHVYAVGAMITSDAYPRKTALMKNYAIEHRMAVMMANYSGITGGSESAGRSAIWSEDGREVAVSAGSEEALVVGKKERGAWTGTVSPLNA